MTGKEREKEFEDKEKERAKEEEKAEKKKEGRKGRMNGWRMNKERKKDYAMKREGRKE